MTALFPHTLYAEDQPLSHTILHTHVQLRALPVGATLGLATSLLRRRVLPPTTVLLRASGTGVLSAMAVLALATEGRMFGRENIEWKDRSWRLLENEGQKETDEWTVGGAMGGIASAAALGISRKGRGAGVGPLGVRGWLGAAGLGGFAGVVGYFGWRYGVFGGKRPKDDL